MPELTAAASDADEAARKFEARKLTQDGFIWPVARSAMRHPLTIRARMIEDLRFASATTQSPAFCRIALAASGWTLAQVSASSDRAIEEFFRVK